MLDPQQAERAITGLRAAYTAFNHGDIDGAVAMLDPNVKWSEPAEFPGGGVYNGVESVKHYLAQSRAGAAEVISEPERFLPAGDMIIVFVKARVLPKQSNSWREIRLADVYTFHGSRVTQMHAFAHREDALRWAGVQEQ